MTDELDEARRQALEMLSYLGEQHAKACEPYLKILADIERLRPMTVTFAGGDAVVPVEWRARG
jgi:hypothetical protein